MWGPDGFRRVTEQAGPQLAKVIEQGADDGNLFLESSQIERHRLRQAVRSGVPEPPLQTADTNRLAGGSVTAYGAGRAATVCLEDASREAVAGACSAAVAEVGESAASRTLPFEIMLPAAEAFPPAEIESLPGPLVREHSRRLAEACLGLDTEVRDVSIEVSDRVRRLWIATTYGHGGVRVDRHSTTRVECRLLDGRVVAATCGSAGTAAPDTLWDLDTLLRDVQHLIWARPAKSPRGWDSIPVVFAAGWCAGTWVHEAVGHFLEADNPFLGEIGSRIAPSAVTIVDDPTTPAGRGSYPFDDEGLPATRVALVVDGVLVSRMGSVMTRRGRHLPTTSNGRRQDYRFRPLARMTNISMNGRDGDADALVGSLTRGLFIREMRGGAVDAATGEFSFEVTLAHPIQSGELMAPVSGLTLTGGARSALEGIRAVADDMMMDNGRGFCVKGGQTVPVGLGGPTVLVEGLKVRAGSRALDRGIVL